MVSPTPAAASPGRPAPRRHQSRWRSPPLPGTAKCASVRSTVSGSGVAAPDLASSSPEGLVGAVAVDLAGTSTRLSPGASRQQGRRRRGHLHGMSRASLSLTLKPERRSRLPGRPPSHPSFPPPRSPAAAVLAVARLCRRPLGRRRGGGGGRRGAGRPAVASRAAPGEGGARGIQTDAQKKRKRRLLAKEPTAMVSADEAGAIETALKKVATRKSGRQRIFC